MVTTTAPLTNFPPEVTPFFPYIPRPGQAMLVKEIYYGVLSKNQVAIEGAAGMGKTISCLSALLPFCERDGCTILYVARTHTQMQRVIEELAEIRKKGHPLTGICLTGRANMCLNAELEDQGPAEAMELCKIMRKKHQCDWYENLLSKEIETVDGCFTAEYIREFAERSGICPYFLGKKLIPSSNVIALTYPYLIDPFIRSVFFKDLQRDVKDCIIVFDECHNLPDIAMNTMSLGISESSLERATKEFHRYDPREERVAVGVLIRHFHKFLENCKRTYGTTDASIEVEVGVDKKALLDSFKEFVTEHSMDFTAVIQEIKQLGWQIKARRIDAKESPYSSISHFGAFLDHFLFTYDKPQYLHYLILTKQIYYYIRCIDCRGILKPLQEARSIVSMSGTLDPIEAYLEICGFPSMARRLVLPSPFDQRMVAVLNVKGIDISFYKRVAAQYDLCARRCLEVVRGTPKTGNTAIFCASYEVLEGLLATPFADQVKQLRRPFYQEQKDLSSKDNNDMITKYKADGHAGKGAVLVGVCGGRNSEGVDFPGLEMYSVVVLGVPLARMTYSISTLIKYYTELFGFWKGKEYAYTLPALRKANQAAGRPIRRLDDFGVIVLLDERFAYPSYRRYLSSWLNEHMVIVNNADGVLEAEVNRFYATHPAPKSKGGMKK